jgi:serine/threonine-protein kinase
MVGQPAARPAYQVPPSAQRVDEACDRFEADARAGRSPRIEDYLAEADGEWRAALLRELLLLEIELNRSAGRSPEPGAYRARFPGNADLVDAAFAEAARDLSAPPPVDPRTPGRQGVEAKPDQRKSAASRLVSPTIGRYVVMAKLGEGPREVVYRVLHPELGKEVLLRWARRAPEPGQGSTEPLADERARLAELDHPNLVRVVDLGDHQGRPYLVTEDVAGLDLAQHAARHRPNARTAAALVAELACAVGYLHRREVVHQDVRAGNVLIDAAGRPRLIGSAPGRLRHAWSPTSGVGAPAPSAPEQADGSGDRVGPATDVFGLGAVLYELLAGRPPDPGATPAGSREPAGGERLTPPRRHNPRVPKALERICLRALADDPGDRYPGASDLERALRRYLRRRGIATGALAAAFALLSLATCVLWYRPPQTDSGSPPSADLASRAGDAATPAPPGPSPRR